ncbi:MAG: hypothetical protein LBE27_07810 [Deltaproteobacteria bacterium]|nr:hypothetical protein [Deltaproteobacteria bacterium]
MKAEAFVKGLPQRPSWLFTKSLFVRVWLFIRRVILDEYGRDDFEEFIHETHQDALERVEREHRNRGRWFIIAMLSEPESYFDEYMGLATWGNSAPVSLEVHRHLASFLHKMRRTGLLLLWGEGMDRRHKALLMYSIVLMLNYNNREIPPQCLDAGEYFRNLMNYRLTKYDIESFDEFLALNGEHFQGNLMKYFLRLRHRCLVGLSSCPPFDDRVTTEGVSEVGSDRVNYRLVINYEGHPVYFTTYSRKNQDPEKFMRIVFALKKKFKMRRMYCFGDTNHLWVHEPNVISEVRYNDMPVTLERRIEDLYRRRHLQMAYYEHQNFEFTVSDPAAVLGRRMVVFNQPELIIERRQYRALKILELSHTINAINDEFRKRGHLDPRAMFVKLYERFTSEELERLSRFLMVSFHGEYGLYMVVDKMALRKGSVVDKLCVTTTTTGAQYLETQELGLVGRNFIRNRVYFETDFWKKIRLLENIGIKRKTSINSILLFSAFLRHYLLYMIY